MKALAECRDPGVRYSLIDTFTDTDDLLSVAPLLDGNETLLSGGIEDFLNSLSDIKKMGLSGQLAVLLHIARGSE